MLHRHGHEEDERTLQHSIEKSARLSKLAFQAPPVYVTYGVVVLLAPLVGLLLEPSLHGLRLGVVLLGIPALLAGAASAPLAAALGGTLYYKRAAFLAALGVSIVGLVLLGSIPFQILWDFPVHWALLFGFMSTASVRHVVLYATSDNRHLRSLPISLLPALLAVPLIANEYEFGRAELILTALLPWVFLGSTVYFLHVFDAPLRRNFGVSVSEMFRYYLDHLTTGRLQGEEILGRFSEGIRAKVGVFGFRRGDGSLKAAVVAPAVHPGPIGRLGGGDLPRKIRESLPHVDQVLVPHGSATHDYNPVSTREVERLGEAVRNAVAHMAFAPGGSAATTAGERVRITCQAFGDPASGGSLLTYTSWPEPIDDVEYGVGLAAELSARLGGAPEAVFVDCHNSLVPGSGAVFLCTPKADEILANARAASEEATRRRVAELRVGAAQDASTFSKRDGIGDLGVQVLAVEAGGRIHAYILWDGNNAVPEVTGLVAREVTGLVDGFSLMTTDNHSVNAVAGAYGPVGHLVPPERIAQVTRETVARAVADLEPCTSGFARVTVENLRVFGHQKTVQLTSSINVMTSIVGELVAGMVVTQALGAALLFYLVGIL